MLAKFVIDDKKYYFKLGYNVHNLLHSTECVKRFGSVNKFSASPFVSCIGTINSKRLVIQQIANRLAEFNRLNVKYSSPAPKDIFSYQVNDKDCFVQLENQCLGKIVSEGKDHYPVYCFGSSYDLFCYPLNSKEVGVYVVRKYEEVR